MIAKAGKRLWVNTATRIKLNGAGRLRERIRNEVESRLDLDALKRVRRAEGAEVKRLIKTLDLI